MAASRSLASLCPSLLARKGGARPAMRAQAGAEGIDALAETQAALGWDDMGDDEPVIAARPPAKLELVAKRRRAAFTLRLDAERHLRLRLASTLRDVSAQALVTEALDQFLGQMPQLDTLAEQIGQNAEPA